MIKRLGQKQKNTKIKSTYNRHLKSSKNKLSHCETKF